MLLEHTLKLLVSSLLVGWWILVQLGPRRPISTRPSGVTIYVTDPNGSELPVK